MSEHTPDARIAAHKAVDAIVLKREHPASMPSEWAALAKEAHAAIDHALKMVAPDLLAAVESAPEPRVWTHPTASDLETMLAVREWAAIYFEWYRSVRAAALVKARKV